MIKNHSIKILILALLFGLSGCAVRSYTQIKERVDQDLSAGNRGYLTGEKTGMDAQRPKTRKIRVVEVELPSLKKLQTVPAGTGKVAMAEEHPCEFGTENEKADNGSYLARSLSPVEVGEPAARQTYTVKEGDTLQEISLRFYGTTRKWERIYEANQGILKGPNKIYPGQVINIPIFPLSEAEENLK